GTAGISGDGGLATRAQISFPWGIAVDDAGTTIFISDTGNHRIRKITPDGLIRTIAGDGTAGYSGDNGPAANARLNQPRRILLDKNGDLYIADARNQAIRRISGASGTITTVVGSGSPGLGGDGGPAEAALLNYPTGLALDSSGVLIFSDQSNDR